MSRKKKIPGLELGPILIDQVREYLGVRTINKLTPVQWANLSRCCNVLGETVGEIIEDDSGTLRTLTTARIHINAPGVTIDAAGNVVPVEREGGGQ